eukprot:maker-scaffold547_size140190-snap-gene-0.32 protein:Tk03238 transcript:maker-scaffold547_size140190-snap-gene-0.32-mRNA-1 annotation:"coiled-coil domain-containing protein 77-like"
MHTTPAEHASSSLEPLEQQRLAFIDLLHSCFGSPVEQLQIRSRTRDVKHEEARKGSGPPLEGTGGPEDLCQAADMQAEIGTRPLKMKSEGSSQLKMGGYFQAELMEHKQLVDGYKSRLLVSEVESENLKEQTQNVKDILKKRTKAMVEQVEVLKERYESLEQRKKKETEGYQADVHRLEQKIKKIEAQLVASAISKSKEHDYIRTIKSYEKELDDLKRSLKKNPQWLN